MANLNLCCMSVLEARTRIRDRRTSPVDLVKNILQRIRKLNPKLNAYCVLAKDATEGTEEAERAAMKGEVCATPFLQG
ncbi:MAG: hypothetical protein ACE5NJ_10760 [Thermodesulfobacteriota bacterium]